MSCDSCKIPPRSDRDRRLSVGLRAALGLDTGDDDSLRAVWRCLYVAGLVDKSSPVANYEL